MEIKLNNIYNYFDDGKIRESRRLPVVITEIIPFDKIDNQTLLDWKDDVETCHWIYAKETDYFVKGDLKICENQIESIVFVRTLNNDWFSLGWWGGRLDVDGSLTNNLNNKNI